MNFLFFILFSFSFLYSQENKPELVVSSNPAAKIEILNEEGTMSVKKLVEVAKTYKDENEAGISKEEKEARSKIKKEISSILDIKEMAHLILKNHWSKLKENERQQYAQLMENLVEKIGYPQISDYFNKNIEIKYVGEKEIDTNKRLVSTNIIYHDEDLTLSTDFYVYKAPNGIWRIYDVITDGDSLLLIYRNQHMNIIKEKGFPELIRLMKKKLDSSQK